MRSTKNQDTHTHTNTKTVVEEPNWVMVYQQSNTIITIMHVVSKEHVQHVLTLNAKQARSSTVAHADIGRRQLRCPPAPSITSSPRATVTRAKLCRQCVPASVT